MKIPCEIIIDLLPLYHDGVCNEKSKQTVEEHLAECESCTIMLERIRNNTVDTFLQRERENVIRQHTQAVRKRTVAVGGSIASIMAIPILVTFIVNLATGRALDWFFIVLTSLMTLASVTVVPLLFEKEKRLWTLGCFTASLTLLLLTCALYSGGDWFFVAVIPVLFGLSVLFAPYVISRFDIPGHMGHHKGLIVMAVDTILLYAVIIVSGLYSQTATWQGYWHPAFIITSICIILPWGLFLAIRYIKANALVKAGVCAIFGSSFLAMIDNMINWIIEGDMQFQFRNADLLDWSNSNVVDANVILIILIAGCLIGGILLIIGLLRNRKINQ